MIADPADNYDLFAFDQAFPGAEWRNYKVGDNFTVLESGKGYLYASKEDVTLSFTGTLYSGNLVGNPYNETVYIADGRAFYTMNSDGSDLMVSTSSSIEAMEGIFVIAIEDGETLAFTTAPQAPQKGGVALNISQGRGLIDRAIVCFDEDNSQQKGCLPKFQLRDNSTKVYIPQDNRDYAVVNAEDQGEMPINFKAAKNGVYTLSISETFSSQLSAFSFLHLIDNLTGANIDLLQTPSYTFTARSDDYASRFKLVFSTGSDADDDFAFISNGEIIVNG